MISRCDAARETNETRPKERIVLKETRKCTNAGTVFDCNLISYQRLAKDNGNYDTDIRKARHIISEDKHMVTK